MSTQPPAWAIDAARAAYTGHPAALPSVTLAQFADESAWGTKLTGTFNFGGIKAMPGHPYSMHPTHEEVKGHLVPVLCAFRDFASPQEYFDVHADLLQHGAGCAAYRAALPDIRKATDLLGHGRVGQPRYATVSDYGARLMAIITGSGLTRYDPVVARQA